MKVLVFNQTFVKTFLRKSLFFLNIEQGPLPIFSHLKTRILWNLFVSISTVVYWLFLLTQDKISIDTELIRNIAELLPFRRRRRCYRPELLPFRRRRRCYRLGPFDMEVYFAQETIWTQNEATLFRFFYLCFLMCIR